MWILAPTVLILIPRVAGDNWGGAEDVKAVPRHLVYFQLEGPHLYGAKTSLEMIQLVIMQATCISPYQIQQLDHSEMLIEFSMDVDVSWMCDDISHIEHWLGVECKINV